MQWLMARIHIRQPLPLLAMMPRATMRQSAHPRHSSVLDNDTTLIEVGLTSDHHESGSSTTNDPLPVIGLSETQLVMLR